VVDTRKIMILRELVVRRKSKRRVPKDKKSGVPKKYLGRTKGGKRTRLAAVIKRIAKLYKEGKRVPKSLLAERMRLGKSGSKKKKR
jgi:hypothetical protein